MTKTPPSTKQLFEQCLEVVGDKLSCGHVHDTRGSMGVPTGLDFDALMALRRQVAQWLDGEPLHGAIWRAGLPKTLLHT